MINQQIILYGLALVLLLFTACLNNSDTTADLVILNGDIATMEVDMPTAEAIAIKAGKILKIGKVAAIQPYVGEQTKQIDANGQFVMPGFIEGHGHFSSLGEALTKLNLMNSKNWQEIIRQVKEKSEKLEKGTWVSGRGWHQEKWDTPLEKSVEGYPLHDALSAVSEEHPVILNHASGHSLFANKKAMELAGVTKETADPKGGHIVRDANGEAVGVFEETAMNIIQKAYQDYLDGLSQEELVEEWYGYIKVAEQECLKKGITSFQDAGASYAEIERYAKLAKAGELALRLWVMISAREELADAQLNRFPMIDVGNQFFTCRAIKGYADGALGVRGAWLLKPYEDMPNSHGKNTTPLADLINAAKQAMKHDLQICIHGIGDRANREILNIYENIFKANPNKKNLRWRIEHAQHVNTADIPRFATLGVIPSMQGIHCTSDAPFVPKRLGEFRAKMEAYAWRQLIDAGATIVNGTDAPVEDVNPLPSYYASVTRQLKNSKQSFFPEQAMTRLEALKSYTINNAYGAFEETSKGSLKEGKLADIVILSNNLLTVEPDKILETKVLYTIVNGKVVYRRKK